MMSRGNYGTASAYDRFYSYDEKPKMSMLSDFSGGIGDQALSSLMNMEVEQGRLVSIGAPSEEAFDGGFADGAVRDHRYADGVWLFRKGRTLYAHKDELISLVGTNDMLTADEGAVYELGGKFYVIDGERICSVTRELSVSVVSQRIPVCMSDLSRDGMNYTAQDGPNPFSRYIDIIIGADAASYQLMPTFVAYDASDITVFLPDSEDILSSDRYTYDGNALRFADINPAGCRMRLKLLDSDANGKMSFADTAYLRELLSQTKTLLPYSCGNRAYFLTWQGRELLLIACEDDLFSSFSEDRITRLPMGETITAVIAYSEGYLLFTEHSVKKLSVVKDEFGALTVHTEILKQDVGSDMPKSVCAFDDKILFASSRGGVFYINKFGIAERDMSRKISENIEDGDLGFFSHTEEEYREANGICAFGKYYLTVGDVTYIWDYGAKLPSSAQSTSDERKMVWTLSDAMAGMDFLQVTAGRLYLWDRATQTLRFFENGKGAEGAVASFVTAEQDFGTTEKKMLVEIGIRYRASAAISVKVILDGRETLVRYMLPPHDAMTTSWLRPYAKRFEKAAVLVSAENDFTAEAVMFRYI